MKSKIERLFNSWGLGFQINENPNGLPPPVEIIPLEASDQFYIPDELL
jgi:hypothetical protein